MKKINSVNYPGFGIRLKRVRDRLGLEQSEFASKIGLTAGGVSLIENEKRGTSEPVLKQICSLYYVNRDWLLTGFGEMFTPPPPGSPSGTIPNALVGDLDELLRNAREVLSSGNAMAAEALAKNIKYFAHAVQQERRLAKVETGQAATDAKMAALMEEFIRLKEFCNLGHNLDVDPDQDDSATSSTDKAI